MRDNRHCACHAWCQSGAPFRTAPWLTEAATLGPVPGRYSQPLYRALAGPSRQALLATLQRVGRPIDAGEAGAAVGLHPNTARAHLDLLCSAGVLKRRTEERSRRGRPRVLYEVASAVEGLLDNQAAPRTEASYRDLARVLAQQLAEVPNVPQEAVRAGRRWASVLEKVSLSSETLSAEEAVAVVTGLFERLGFRPEADLVAGELRLRRCPYIDVARENRVVVCGAHLGMLKATIERLGAPLEAVGLDPLVSDEPTLCIVHLALREAPKEAVSRPDDV